MDDLLNDFIAETREMLEALSGGLVAWDAAGLPLAPEGGYVADH